MLIWIPKDFSFNYENFSTWAKNLPIESSLHASDFGNNCVSDQSISKIDRSKMTLHWLNLLSSTLQLFKIFCFSNRNIFWQTEMLVGKFLTTLLEIYCWIIGIIQNLPDFIAYVNVYLGFASYKKEPKIFERFVIERYNRCLYSPAKEFQNML